MDRFKDKTDPIDRVGKFAQFHAELKYIEECKNIVPRHDCAIIQIFIFRDSGSMVDTTSISMGKITKGQLHLHCYAKVLQKSEKYLAGDIVKMPNSLQDKPVEDPEWRRLMKLHEEHPDSEPKPSEEDRWVGDFAINKFMKQYAFCPRPFHPEDYADVYIALIPEYIIEGKMDPALMME